MKLPVFAAILFITMLSCTYNGIEPMNNRVANPVIREAHYNFTTGVQVAEKNYTYDDNGNLIHEVFTSEIDKHSSNEVLYEYNSNNYLVKRTDHYPESWDGDVRYITEYAYKDGQKISESNYSERDQNAVYKTLFFYSGAQIDSVQYVTTSVSDHRTWVNSTLLYRYDDQKRLVEKAFSHRLGSTVYHYDSDRLVSTCDYMDVYGVLRETCRDNEFNSDGQIVKIFEKSELGLPPTTHQLQEELFYKVNLLDERRVYTYPNHQASEAPVITQIKYEY